MLGHWNSELIWEVSAHDDQGGGCFARATSITHKARTQQGGLLMPVVWVNWSGPRGGSRRRSRGFCHLARRRGGRGVWASGGNRRGRRSRHGRLVLYLGAAQRKSVKSQEMSHKKERGRALWEAMLDLDPSSLWGWGDCDVQWTWQLVPMRRFTLLMERVGWDGWSAWGSEEDDARRRRRGGWVGMGWLGRGRSSGAGGAGGLGSSGCRRF
jgi:hypothetical protein